jgi:hypothetical protein
VSYSQKRVSYTSQPRQDSLGNSGDPNARVAFAGENKDFLRESIAPEAKSSQQPWSGKGSACLVEVRPVEGDEGASELAWPDSTY